MDVQDLFEHIKFISEEAAHILREAVPYGPDILSLTMKDLNKHLPGERNSQNRINILGLIDMYLKEQTRQSMDSGLAVMNLAPEVPQSRVHHSGRDLPQWLMATQDVSKPKITGPVVKVHVLVAGETFCTHDTFMKKLKLQIKRCSAESCSIILVFCPVVSQIRTDMEAAMARVTEDKPVILVFMHHCHNPSHMTNITVQPSRSNTVQVVHCAYHETKGLLQCKENEQAVATVHSQLNKYQ
nr:uncharacterized protein LOC111840501 isoform X2 [Paramormyrops kingsleyae]